MTIWDDDLDDLLSWETWEYCNQPEHQYEEKCDYMWMLYLWLLDSGGAGDSGDRLEELKSEYMRHADRIKRAVLLVREALYGLEHVLPIDEWERLERELMQPLVWMDGGDACEKIECDSRVREKARRLVEYLRGRGLEDRASRLEEAVKILEDACRGYPCGTYILSSLACVSVLAGDQC